jgi:hypothetical protein
MKFVLSAARHLFFVMVLFAPMVSNADAIFFDANLFYNSDSFTLAQSSTSTRMLYDISFGFGVDKKNYFEVGWNLTGHSMSDSSNGATTAYSTTQMGPIFIFFIGKERSWRLSAAYNLQTSATYTAAGGTSEKWKGTGIAASFGHQFSIGQTASLGIRLNYSMSSFTESLIGTTYSVVSYTRAYIYPSVAMNFEF